MLLSSQRVDSAGRTSGTATSERDRISPEMVCANERPLPGPATHPENAHYGRIAVAGLRGQQHLVSANFGRRARQLPTLIHVRRSTSSMKCLRRCRSTARAQPFQAGIGKGNRHALDAGDAGHLSTKCFRSAHSQRRAPNRSAASDKARKAAAVVDCGTRTWAASSDTTPPSVTR